MTINDYLYSETGRQKKAHFITKSPKRREVMILSQPAAEPMEYH